MDVPPLRGSTMRKKTRCRAPGGGRGHLSSKGCNLSERIKNPAAKTQGGGKH